MSYMDDNKLKVKYGTIYTPSGIGIDNMAVVIDKNGGLMKYGDAERSLDKYYENMIDKYQKAGITDICNDLVYIKFDRYNGTLSIEEICTFVNYMLMCSANGEKIMKMINMSVDELKQELSRLSEFGY